MDHITSAGQIRFAAYRFSPTAWFIVRLLRWWGNHNLVLQYAKAFGTQKWDTDFVKNTITNAGKAQIALLAGDASAVPFTYLAVGTSTTAVAATDTTLTAEIVDSGLARVAATVSRVTTTVTNDTLQLTTTWTASGSKTVEEVGLFNAASVGTMLGHALTTSKAVANGDLLIGTYQVKFA